MGLSQRDYYNFRYSKFKYVFLRIHYAIRYQVVKYFIRKTLSKNFIKNKRLRILDFGCGLGEFGIFFEKELGHAYVGLDISEEGVKFAKEALGLRAICGDILKMNTNNLGRFDVILLHEVLEHLEFPEITLTYLLNLLSFGGILIITTPNRNFYSFIPKNPAHIKEYTQDDLKKLASKLNLTIDIRPIGGYLLSLAEAFQRKMFPVGAQEKTIYFKRLGIKEACWIIMLKPLTAICIIESFIMRIFRSGYVLFAVLKQNSDG